MIGIYLGGSPKYGCILSTARGTWNFVRHLATLAQGSASEAHLNMDVNMRRLPELMKNDIEILSASCWLYTCIGSGQIVLLFY